MTETAPSDELLGDWMERLARLGGLWACVHDEMTLEEILAELSPAMLEAQDLISLERSRQIRSELSAQIDHQTESACALLLTLPDELAAKLLAIAPDRLSVSIRLRFEQLCLDRESAKGRSGDSRDRCL